MSGMLLQLSLCIMTVIQLTSSQSTYDIIQQDDDVYSCESMYTPLMTAVSQMQQVLSQLQRDVADLKDGKRRHTVAGYSSLKHLYNNTDISTGSLHHKVKSRLSILRSLLVAINQSICLKLISRFVELL